MRIKTTLVLNTFLLGLLLINVTGCEKSSDAPVSSKSTEYTVTFNANGGTLAGAATVKVETGKKVTQPQTPTRLGFSFVEWQKADGTAFNFATETISANITLTANWRSSNGLITYVVIFDANNGVLAGNATVDVDDGQAVPEPMDPTREGFTFVEWRTVDGTAFDFTTIITAGITLTAEWRMNANATIYTVTFDPNQGMLTGDAMVDVVENETVVQPTDPTREGFSFVEWQDPNGTAFNFATGTITADITLTANWRSAGTVTMVALTANMMDDGYTVTYTYTNADGTATGGTPEVTWLVSDNPDGSDATQVAMGMEVTYTPMGANRYQNLVASVRIMDAGGGFTAAVASTPVFTGFSKQATGTMGRFPARDDHTSVVFDGSMWVIGGNDRNDVWSSDDGTTWTQVRTNGAANGFTARNNHTSVVFMDSIWVIAGRVATTGLLGAVARANANDIWSSSDGITWRQVTANAGFTARQKHTSVVFMGNIWVIGGSATARNVTASTNDVWSSPNGRDWTQVRTNGAMNGFTAREDHTSVVLGNSMWVISGTDDRFSFVNDVWSSTNGMAWTQRTTNARFQARDRFAAVAFDNKMWVIGGGGGDVGTPLRDVWNSADGITWTQLATDAVFPNRFGHTSVVFNDRMWVIGGTNTTDFNDAWY